MSYRERNLTAIERKWEAAHRRRVRMRRVLWCAMAIMSLYVLLEFCVYFDIFDAFNWLRR